MRQETHEGKESLVVFFCPCSSLTLLFIDVEDQDYTRHAKQSLFTCLLVFPTYCFGQFLVWLGGSVMVSGAISPRDPGHVLGTACPRGAGWQRVRATTPARTVGLTLHPRSSHWFQTQRRHVAEVGHWVVWRFIWGCHLQPTVGDPASAGGLD